MRKGSIDTFPANRSRSTYFPLIIGFAIILSPVVAFIFYPSSANMTFSWGMLFPISLFAFFLYVLLSSSLKMFITYKVDRDGITIYKPPFHSRFASFGEIENLEYLSPEETKKIIEASILEQNSYGDTANLAGYIRMIRTKSPFYRYYTIAPHARVTTTGPRETITSLDVGPTGGSVRLSLKNGEIFYLTPENPERFIKAFNRFRT